MPHVLRTIRAGALDPVDRASEVIFGVLMAMTFVGTVSVAEGGREELRTLLIAALGCNLAWGITDGVMYLVGAATEARRNRALLLQLHAEVDAAAGRRIVAASLLPGLAAVLDEDDLERLRIRLLDAPVPAGAPRLGLDDYRAALAVFVLVVLATFPGRAAVSRRRQRRAGGAPVAGDRAGRAVRRGRGAGAPFGRQRVADRHRRQRGRRDADRGARRARRMKTRRARRVIP